MAAINRGDEKVGGVETLEKPPVVSPKGNNDKKEPKAPAAPISRAGMNPKWIEYATKNASRPMETMKKANPASEMREVKFDTPVTEPLKQKKASTDTSKYGTRNIPMPKPESLHMEGHDHWNTFVNLADKDEEVRGQAAPNWDGSAQGIENARVFATSAKGAMSHHGRAQEIIGADNFDHVHGLLSEVSEGLAHASEHGLDPLPFIQKHREAVGMMAQPERADEAIHSIHAFHNGVHKAGAYMSKLGIPDEHHGDIFSSASTWEPPMKKSLSIWSKLRKALPTPKEDKQETLDSSPSLDRVTKAPAEGKTRPFADTKEAFKRLKDRHATLVKKIEQSREDGDADATSIYSMNEADVSKPLEKSKPSYKTLRTAKLPGGTKVNVYGNNGYERISNGPHRGRYLHSVLAEHKLGRKLKNNEEIDHKNGDRKGNNAGNLRLTTTSEHASHTNAARAKKGGFTGEKRYMHSREYTEGKPESMEKGLSDFTTGELQEARRTQRTSASKQSPQYKSAVKGIVARMKARKASDALSSHEVDIDFAQEQREGKVEAPKGTGAPAWQKPMQKAFNPDEMFKPSKSEKVNPVQEQESQKQNEKFFEGVVSEAKKPTPAESGRPSLKNFTAKFRMRKSKK